MQKDKNVTQIEPLSSKTRKKRTLEEVDAVNSFEEIEQKQKNEKPVEGKSSKVKPKPVKIN